MVHFHLKSVLDRTKGRFTSFLVKDNSRIGLSVYSAKHISASPKTVVFGHQRCWEKARRT